jgi:RNA polymerase primary sigma factor
MKANLPLAVTASAVKPRRATTVRAPRPTAPKIAPRRRVVTNSRLQAEASKRTRQTSVYQPARAKHLPDAVPATDLVLPPAQPAADKVVFIPEPAVGSGVASFAPAVAAPVREARGPWDENTSLRIYLREAVETPLLTPQEEIQLAHRIQAGDEAAREHMIKANLRLVVKIAREYEDYGLPLLDLINEGNMGLMRAVERFDPTKGAKLSTYAAWWIKQSIKRALSNQAKSIRLPIHLVQQIAQLRRAENQFEAKHGRPAKDSELAILLEVSEDDIAHWRESAVVGTSSLDAPLGSDADSGKVADVIADEAAAMPWAAISEETNAELIRDLVGSLNAREQTILRRRFALDGGEPVTLEEIGIDFGLTRERIRQLEAAALKKLRDRIDSREKMAA